MSGNYDHWQKKKSNYISKIRNPVISSLVGYGQGLGEKRLVWMFVTAWTNETTVIPLKELRTLFFIRWAPKPSFPGGSVVKNLPANVGGFPGSSGGKESCCTAGDPSSIPGSGISAKERIGYPVQYAWASLVAQLVKNPPATWSLGWEDPLEKGKATHLWIWSLGLEDPLEKEMVTHSSILAWAIPGTEV